MRRYLRSILFFVVSYFVAVASSAASDNPAGIIVSLTPGAFVERHGTRIALQIKDPIYAGDSLITDTTGRLRIWMRDDTTVSLGLDTEFTLEEYDDKTETSTFSSKMTGFARILTGKIVQANPEGFNVITPVSRIGIRGTILSIEAGQKTTTVFVENTMHQVLVNGIAVPSGSKAIVNALDAAPQIVPINPIDRQRIRDAGRSSMHSNNHHHKPMSPGKEHNSNKNVVKFPMGENSGRHGPQKLSNEPNTFRNPTEPGNIFQEKGGQHPQAGMHPPVPSGGIPMQHSSNQIFPIMPLHEAGTSPLGHTPGGSDVFAMHPVGPMPPMQPGGPGLFGPMFPSPPEFHMDPGFMPLRVPPKEILPPDTIDPKEAVPTNH